MQEQGSEAGVWSDYCLFVTYACFWLAGLAFFVIFALESKRYQPFAFGALAAVMLWFAWHRKCMNCWHLSATKENGT